MLLFHETPYKAQRRATHLILLRPAKYELSRTERRDSTAKRRRLHYGALA